MKLQVLQHLAMGDHVLCNGLVRNLLKSYEEIELFARNTYFEAVCWMYRDEPRISVSKVLDANVARSQFDEGVQQLVVGFENLVMDGCHFDEALYRSASIDFSHRWDSFYYERDLVREQKLYDHYGVGENEYIIVHEDKVRNFIIDRTTLRNDKKIISVLPMRDQNGGYYSIFDYLMLLENASEIHCIDSAFRCLIESMEVFLTKKLYFHPYARDNTEEYNISERMNWIRIEPSQGYYEYWKCMKIRSGLLLFWEKVRRNLKN